VSHFWGSLQPELRDLAEEHLLLGDVADSGPAVILGDPGREGVKKLARMDPIRDYRWWVVTARLRS